MSDLDKNTKTPEPIQPVRAPQLALDDQRRIKVLSPGMLVAKRFFRNRLALIGLVILVVMFIFSFLGPILSPYTQTEVFYTENELAKDYAGAIINTELRYVVAQGQEFGALARANFLLAFGKQQPTFTANNVDYTYVEEAQGTYRIMQLHPVAEDLLGQLIPAGDAVIPTGLERAYLAAKDAKQTIFTMDGENYHITTQGRKSFISTEQNVALASLSIYDPYNADDAVVVDAYPFRFASSVAIRDNKKEFEVGGKSYTIVYGEGFNTIKTADGKTFAEVSTIIVNPLDQREFLPVEFKTLARKVITDRGTKFEYDGTEYTVVRVNTNYYIKRETTSVVIKMFDFPSYQHPVGTDNNGMDQMTRLMYGDGRFCCSHPGDCPGCHHRWYFRLLQWCRGYCHDAFCGSIQQYSIFPDDHHLWICNGYPGSYAYRTFVYSDGYSWSNGLDGHRSPGSRSDTIAA